MPKIISNLKEELMIKGKDILVHKGYNALNIRDLAKNCNIGIGTFYNYYQNKDELVRGIIKTDWEKIVEETHLKIYNSDKEFKEKIYIIYDGINKFLSNYLDTFMVMVSAGGKKHKSDKILIPYENILKEILNYHKESGDINYEISSEKLAKLILNNIIYICRDRSINFEEFYLSLNLKINS
ncbi:MAG: TetR/AcrR family transcriptional regulator [Clostridium perfringens]|nr:TetR/AcrR family transcriptional regulator [Clostridium perfringens]